MNLFDMSPLKEKEAHFRRLLDVANLGALTPQERAIYDENLKRIGLEPSVIAQCTGLSLEEINDLENLIRKEEIKC